MEKAEKIRKTVTRISAGVIFACLLVMTLQIGFQGTNGNSPLSLSALTFGLFKPAVANPIYPIPCWGGGTPLRDAKYTDCNDCASYDNMKGDGRQSLCKKGSIIPITG